jgi:predicted component of type VI protein secretion system
MQFLLERLAGTANKNEPFDLRTAIAAQIQRIVSTRALATDVELNLLEMGCENLVDIALNNKIQLERYARRLTRLIKRYEPRLLLPKVCVQAGSDALHTHQLVIKGSLSPTTEAEVFYFELPLHY